VLAPTGAPGPEAWYPADARGADKVERAGPPGTAPGMERRPERCPNLCDPALTARARPAQWLAFHYPCTSSLAEKAALMDLGLGLLEAHAPLTFG